MGPNTTHLHNSLRQLGTRRGLSTRSARLDEPAILWIKGYGMCCFSAQTWMSLRDARPCRVDGGLVVVLATVSGLIPGRWTIPESWLRNLLIFCGTPTLQGPRLFLGFAFTFLFLTFLLLKI
ncbi:hypothetical protein GMOD_00000298 [Pyrenophora seminiperda CCB06]|uniref:Uncharacterized protein n=1 Tax=Pyrenophora seminiperda CCB06 TaxID=1302712 RepID=A0A3M7M6W1_9PLEO|nr:hypothetical protein GMOD_00000298 [Pyrenophora seminiperda CCB06]